MDIKKLIEQLKAKDFERDYDCTPFECGVFGLLDTAATALSALQAKNEKLRNELEQVKRERDAAVKDPNEFLAMDELCPIQCEWCKWKDTFCDGKTPKWRGPKED